MKRDQEFGNSKKREGSGNLQDADDRRPLFLFLRGCHDGLGTASNLVPALVRRRKKEEANKLINE